MELYKIDKKPSRFYQYFFVMVVTAVVTIVLERVIIKANEIDEFATKLSYEQEKEVKKENPSEIQETMDFENILESTVGISLIKPSGANILDVDIEEKWGLGTGVIVSQAGYILTNQHLAQKVNSNVVVTLNSGKSVKGKIVWVEANLDLALIKVEEANLKAVRLGNSESISLGEEVYAIGNPLGAEFKGSITKGIISGLNRTILFQEEGKDVFMEGLLQTDASINPGNSGGPLINHKGEVIGINTVKITSAEGIGFAIPVNIVQNVVQSFEETGNFEEVTLGIYAYDNSVIPYMDEHKKYFNGIYVASVEESGPSAVAGLKKGDIIMTIDGLKMEKMSQLREYLYTKKPGEKVTLIVQDGVEKEIEVILRKK